jgi:hypothetical protein
MTVCKMKIVQVEVNPTRPSLDRSYAPSERPDAATAVGGAAVLIPFCFIVVWAVASIIMFRGLPKALRKKPLELNRPQKVPCRSCRFFSSNPYLKCALHPTSVMTDQAIDCADFHTREQEDG